MKNRSERADSFSDISHQIEKIAKKRNRKHIQFSSIKTKIAIMKRLKISDYCCVPRHRRFIKLDLVRWRAKNVMGKKLEMKK